MSILATSSVWLHCEQTCSHKLVMLALADWANGQGQSWYKQQEIADRVRITLRHARRILKALEAQKEIEIQHRKRPASVLNTSNLYTLHPRYWSTEKPADIQGNPQRTSRVIPADIQGHPQRTSGATSERVASGHPRPPDPSLDPSSDPPDHIYIAVSDEEAAEIDEINAIQTALAEISKTTLWVKTEREFWSLAETLYKRGMKPDEIRAFGKDWETNGQYDGLPALTSIANNINNGPLKPSANGQNGQPSPEDVAKEQKRREGRESLWHKT